MGNKAAFYASVVADTVSFFLPELVTIPQYSQDFAIEFTLTPANIIYSAEVRYTNISSVEDKSYTGTVGLTPNETGTIWTWNLNLSQTLLVGELQFELIVTTSESEGAVSGLVVDESGRSYLQIIESAIDFTPAPGTIMGDIIDVLELPSAGGKPVLGYSVQEALELGGRAPLEVENIYFNTSLSTEQVVEILSDLDWSINPIRGMCISIDAGTPLVTNISQLHAHVIVRRKTSSGYLIQDDYLTPGSETTEVLFDSSAGGWRTDWDGVLPVNGIIITSGIELLGDDPALMDREQRQYSHLMSMAPDFTVNPTIREKDVYRVADYQNIGLWFITEDGDEPTLASSVVYHVVGSWPDAGDPVDKGDIVSVYICNNEAKVYSTDSGWMNVADYINATEGISLIYRGYTDYPEAETEAGIYLSYDLYTSLYYYKDGEWHGGSSISRESSLPYDMIRVKTLPSQDIEPDIIYQLEDPMGNAEVFIYNWMLYPYEGETIPWPTFSPLNKLLVASGASGYDFRFQVVEDLSQVNVNEAFTGAHIPVYIEKGTAAMAINTSLFSEEVVADIATWQSEVEKQSGFERYDMDLTNYVSQILAHGEDSASNPWPAEILFVRWKPDYSYWKFNRDTGWQEVILEVNKIYKNKIIQPAEYLVGLFSAEYGFSAAEDSALLDAVVAGSEISDEYFLSGEIVQSRVITVSTWPTNPETVSNAFAVPIQLPIYYNAIESAVRVYISATEYETIPVFKMGLEEARLAAVTHEHDGEYAVIEWIPERVGCYDFKYDGEELIGADTIIPVSKLPDNGGDPGVIYSLEDYYYAAGTSLAEVAAGMKSEAACLLAYAKPVANWVTVPSLSAAFLKMIYGEHEVWDNVAGSYMFAPYGPQLAPDQESPNIRYSTPFFRWLCNALLIEGEIQIDTSLKADYNGAGLSENNGYYAIPRSHQYRYNGQKWTRLKGALASLKECGALSEDGVFSFDDTNWSVFLTMCETGGYSAEEYYYVLDKVSQRGEDRGYFSMDLNNHPLGAQAKSYGTSSSSKFKIKELVLSASMTSIGSKAFESSGLRMLTMPDSITSLGGHLFTGGGDLNTDSASMIGMQLSAGLKEVDYGASFSALSLGFLIVPVEIKKLVFSSAYNMDKSTLSIDTIRCLGSDTVISQRVPAMAVVIPEDIPTISMVERYYNINNNTIENNSWEGASLEPPSAPSTLYSRVKVSYSDGSCLWGDSQELNTNATYFSMFALTDAPATIPLLPPTYSANAEISIPTGSTWFESGTQITTAVAAQQFLWSQLVEIIDGAIANIDYIPFLFTKATLTFEANEYPTSGTQKATIGYLLSPQTDKTELLRTVYQSTLTNKPSNWTTPPTSAIDVCAEKGTLFYSTIKNVITGITP